VNKSLHDYLQKIADSGGVLDFATITFSYGEFTMYCLLGPAENILHLTFAPAKHVSARDQLSTIHPGVCFTSLKQEKSSLHPLLRDYFRGKLSRLSSRINSPFIDAGSDFQRRVWQHISTIPYGKCRTYHELAAMAGSPKAARAAGMACGANPLAVIIPCHRVVAVKGLGGFAGGTGVKKALLKMERNGSALADQEGI
jgi:methylated-DNA-[protein]-cysteine S-methyltransferase